MERETVLILDFGSQYTQLIARRLRELAVYSEILPPGTKRKALAARKPKGILLSGGPDSVHDRGAPRCDPGVFDLGVPVLGVCYGMQLMSHLLGGEVRRADRREYGPALFEPKGGLLLRGLSPSTRVWMSHGDSIVRPPDGFSVVGSSGSNAVAAIEARDRRLFGILFHPEVVHTAEGTTVLGNFLDACGCRRDWNALSFIEDAVGHIRETVGSGRVICALSGGVDSSVAALLVHKAIGDRLTCVFVDNGLLRKDEAAQIRKRFTERMRLKMLFVDARKRFLARLKGVADPERKRKVIGREFIEVFKASMNKVGKADFLAQGTLYPDVIESTSVRGPSAVIKSHHNVGGLPKSLKFKLIEPLRELFKDEVRKVGKELPALPRAGSRGALPGARLEGPARPAARGGRDLDRGSEGGRPLPEDVAVLRGAPAGAVGRGDGRRPHVPVHGGAPGGRVDGRHDGRLGTPALRPPGPGEQPHRERGPRHQPRGVRHLQ